MNYLLIYPTAVVKDVMVLVLFLVILIVVPLIVSHIILM